MVPSPHRRARRGVLCLALTTTACGFGPQLHPGQTSSEGAGMDDETEAETPPSFNPTETTGVVPTGISTTTEMTDVGDGVTTRDSDADSDSDSDSGPDTDLDTDTDTSTDTADGLLDQAWSHQFELGAVSALAYDVLTEKLAAGGIANSDDTVGRPVAYGIENSGDIVWAWRAVQEGTRDAGVASLAIGLNATTYISYPRQDTQLGTHVDLIDSGGMLVNSFEAPFVNVRSLKAHQAGWIALGGYVEEGSHRRGILGSIRRAAVDEPLVLNWVPGCNFADGDNLLVDIIRPAPGRSDMVVRGMSGASRPWLQRCNADGSVSTDWPRSQAASGSLSDGPYGLPNPGSLIQDSQGQLLMLTAANNEGTILEYSSTGDWRWSQPTSHSPTALAPGPAGSFYVAGFRLEAAGVVLILEGRDANGTLMWTDERWSDDNEDRYYALATDGRDLIFVGGRRRGLGTLNALKLPGG